MKKIKDNYGKQSNYNDAKVSLPPGYVGLGYDTKGRNYSPAWGGQFQDGGKVYKSKPMAQSSDIKSASNTFNADDFSQYSTIINKYPNMSNDTSYMYARNTPTGTEQFFHNTNQGKPVSQLQRGNEFINLSPEQVNAYKQKILQGTGGFQDGGILGKTFLQPNSSKLPAASTPGGKKGQMSTELAMSIGGEGGQPGYLIPTFKYGKPLADPEAEFRQTGEHLGGPFKTWQAAEKWGKERHKFVEKGQSVPSPTKTWDEFAMGGGLPGATGMMYARTVNPAPSNGKYAKKTKASAKDGISIQDKGQLKKLDQLTNFTNYNDMAKAKSGININPANKGKFTATKKKTGKSTEELTHSSNPLTRKRAIFAQNAKKWKHADDGGIFNIAKAIGGAFTTPGKAATATSPATAASGGLGDTMMSMFGKDPGAFGKANPAGALGAGGEGFAAGAGAAGIGLLNAAPQILEGIGQIGEQKKAIKKADQMSQVSGVTAQAAESRDVSKPKNQYVRPEDQMIQGLNPQGSGTNFLAAYGARIGGNPTEIQNTYNPGDLYSDLGYEPLNDSNVKQFAHGGNLPTAEFGEYFQNSGQASIGKGAGSAIGSAFFGPVGGAVGGFLGGIAGNALGGVQDARKQKGFEDITKANTERAGVQSTAQGIQSTYKSYMEDGGWVSNDWQPQTITTFGEHKVKDLLKPPYDADMLRSGGSIGEDYYTPPSARALQTYEDGGWMKRRDGTFVEVPSSSTSPSGPEDHYMITRNQLHKTSDGNKHTEDLRKAIYDKNVTPGHPQDEKFMYHTTANNKSSEFFRNAPEGGQAINHLHETEMRRPFLNLIGKKQLMDRYSHPNENKAQGYLKQMNDFIQEPSSENMEYGGQMALGGDLQVHRGKAEAISYNPFLQDGGETVMFKGPSHDDGGMPISYGNNGVEVEGGEPAVKLADGGSPDGNLVVFGNMKIDNMAANHIGVDAAKGKKYKSFINDLSKFESKQNKVVEKGTNLVSNSNTNDPFEQLSMNSGRAMMMGGNAKLLNAAIIKERAAGVQNAILDTAKEYGVKSDELAQGKFVKDKNSDMAKFGKKLSKAKDGSSNITGVDVFGNYTGPQDAFVDKPGGNKSKFDWKGLAEGVTSNLAPLFRPSNQEGLDPNQLYPEMFALASNQLEAVNAQQYSPRLKQSYNISLQDQLNEIDAQTRAATKMIGSNPSAAATIFAQASDAKNKIRGEQFRMNQANQIGTQNANIDTLNQAQMQNLQLLDQQYVRQAQAKSNTKTQTLEAFKSIAAKTAQNKLENRQLGIMENMYNYRFGPSGQAYNINNPYQFNNPTVGSASTNGLSKYEEAKAITNAFEKKFKSEGKDGRNGMIVKALKSL